MKTYHSELLGQVTIPGPDSTTCESCGRTVPADEEGAPALGMTDLYFCPPGFGCSSVDERGRDRLARARATLGTHAEGRRC